MRYWTDIAGLSLNIVKGQRKHNKQVPKLTNLSTEIKYLGYEFVAHDYDLVETCTLA